MKIMVPVTSGGGMLEIELTDEQMELVYREKLRAYQSGDAEGHLEAFAEGYGLTSDDLFEDDGQEASFYDLAVSLFNDRKEQSVPDASTWEDAVSDAVDQLLLPAWRARLSEACADDDTFKAMMQEFANLSGICQVYDLGNKEGKFDNIPACYAIPLMAKFVWESGED